MQKPMRAAIAILTALVPARDWSSWAEGIGTMMLRIEFPLMLTVLGLNLLGDGLRDALDPKVRRAR